VTVSRSRSSTIVSEPLSEPDQAGPSQRPDPEVRRPRRRTFTAAYKLEILQKVEACTESGQIGRLLRQEGLYSSHLAAWRRLHERGALSGLSKKRGPASKATPEAKRLAALEQENQRLSRQIKQLQLVIELQKKTCELLAISSNPDISALD
jgi:transposase-like protein